jgi:site-specific DNA-methyltransferase (adenine-specific)
MGSLEVDDLFDEARTLEQDLYELAVDDVEAPADLVQIRGLVRGHARIMALIDPKRETRPFTPSLTTIEHMRDAPAVQRRTSTSRFGVGRRESHDASGFYERFTAPELSKDEAIGSRREVDEIFVGDARDMADIEDASVALVVTSPPYFAGKEYETALGQGHVPATYGDYLAMLEGVFAECVRKLEPGGRIAVNVANLGRKPYRSLSGDVAWILQDRLRLLLRGEVIWLKGRGATGSCAWGSFQRPTNPVIRDLSERVLIASKGRFDRAMTARQRLAKGLPSESSMFRDEFMEATTDLWEMPSESASRVGHPAPFPVALPERLIHLYTYRGDLVLDPFIGSGSTAIAALRTGRHYAGYDTDTAYVEQAKLRIANEQARLIERPDEAPRVALAAGPQLVPDGEDFQTRALREGRSAKELASAVLGACGFTQIEANVKLRGGVEVGFAASDRAGCRWFFDVAGGFTSTRPGLKRSEALWKALAKAAVVHEGYPATRLIVLTTAVPGRESSAHAALAALVGPERPITDVIVLSSAEDLERLRLHGESAVPSLS